MSVIYFHELNKNHLQLTEIACGDRYLNARRGYNVEISNF